jgi:hypothetical protein
MTSLQTETISTRFITNTVYNFIYLTLSSESIAEVITVKAVAAVYEKLQFADDDTYLFEVIKYVYQRCKLKSKKAFYITRGEELMEILSHYTYDARCVLLMRYKLGYTYEKISEIMKLPVDEVRVIIGNKNYIITY